VDGRGRQQLWEQGVVVAVVLLLVLWVGVQVRRVNGRGRQQQGEQGVVVVVVLLLLLML
jgi:hypothetical protein